MQNKLPEYWFELALNASVTPAGAYPDELTSLFNQRQFDTARDVISRWPGYRPTPLKSLDGIARELGLAALLYKDESQRFGLKSFKPLGGAFAVTQLMRRIIRNRTGEENVETADIVNGRYAQQLSDITVTAATDGNHGRSVAWGASMCGCNCVIFVHENVSVSRERAIADLGADVRRLPGHYDDSVRQAYLGAQVPNWHIIQDTTDGDEVETTLDVMHGYTLMAAEVLDQLAGDEPPTHVFLQAGVGGMAAAVLAHFWFRLGERRPVTILVEPDNAACCYLSIGAGRREIASGSLDSIMAGLACGEVSSLAWDVLLPGAHAAMITDDDSASDCMRLLADSRFGDAPVVAGESAVAGLVGLIAVMQDQGAREQLELNRDSRVLVIGTEGDTDPEIYESIVGRSAEAVCAGQ